MNKAIINYLILALAEILGTAILLFVGCMGCIFGLGEARNSALIGVGVSFGLAVMIGVQAFGCISQAHLNPAVTLACVILKLIPIRTACVYVVAQLIGALLGYSLLMWVTPEGLESARMIGNGICTSEINPNLSPLQGMFVEFAITGILALVVCGVNHPKNVGHLDSVAIRFGLTIWALAECAAPYSSASMNPARSVAPALYNNHFQHLWIYIVGPLLGAAFFTTIYKVAFLDRLPPPLKSNAE